MPGMPELRQFDGPDFEERLRRIERRLALYDLIATYGPAVDSGSADAAAGLWAEDGLYDFGDAALEGPTEVAGMVRSDRHQALINRGAAHMLGFPLIHLDDDAERAVVTGYSQVCLQEDGRFYVWRVSANRWELSWNGSAWEVQSRRAYLLDGRDAARALLAQGVTP